MSGRQLLTPGRVTTQKRQLRNDPKSTDKAPSELAAHEAPLSCIALNLQGTSMATSSEKVRLLDLEIFWAGL